MIIIHICNKFYKINCLLHLTYTNTKRKIKTVLVWELLWCLCLNIVYLLTFTILYCCYLVLWLVAKLQYLWDNLADLELRWIEHRQSLYAIKRFIVDEKSSPDIQVVKKEKKKKWLRFFLLFFGWKTLKRMEDNWMGVENRLTLRLNNQLRSQLCPWFSCVVRLFDKMQFVKIILLVKCTKLKHFSNIIINYAKQHIVIIYLI